LVDGPKRLLQHLVSVFTEEIVPKRKIKKRKPKLQIMSEDILKAIEQKKRAFFLDGFAYQLCSNLLLMNDYIVLFASF
jgi:hypothetical protein